MSEFVFQWPLVLVLLVLTIPLFWLLAHARKRRRELIEVMGGGHSTHRKLRDVLRFAAFVLLILALAKPGYAPIAEATSRTGRDIVFAIDVSQSMLARDALPSRLEVAKQGVRDALQTLSNERVGLIVYAGSASILCPLTYDYDFVRFMLDQANTRTVDFGGTTVQAAVEKAVDQVFLEGRNDVQDLIVLTDGGDHGSVITKAIELLEDKGVDTLLLGLGDPNVGSTIPIADEEGNPSLLQVNGETVTTQLDDVALREFAARSNRIEYLALGTKPFNLGQIYIDYAEGRQVDAAMNETGILVYKEAAIYFLIPALFLLLLSECWGARGLQIGQAVALLCLFALSPDAEATGDSFAINFKTATEALQAGNFEEATTQFSALSQEAAERTATPAQLATVHFNEGLALIGQSKAQSSPQEALSFAQNATLAFLAAKRGDPNISRASVRLELTAAFVSELQIQIEAIEAQNDAINDQMTILIERLQALLKAQDELHAEISKPESANNAATLSSQFVSTQNKLRREAVDIQKLMQSIHQMMSSPADLNPNQETALTEPLNLIVRVQQSQEIATTNLIKLETWELAQSMQVEASKLIQAILDLLANDSQDSSDSEDWDEMEEDYEYMEDSEESTNTSEPMQGDFAANGEMQELPLPNYSADDILLEEQGNLQFRQQKRASANAAKVEKDF
ncbi:MAG: VWA domain-containing protein [Opitutaceae bacterium]